MTMSASPWGWTPYGGCDYYGSPRLANRAPWYGYPSPIPPFASGKSTYLGPQNGQSGGAHRLFVEMLHAYEHIPSHTPGPGSAHDHVQKNCGNVSIGSNDSDSTYWNIHTYQMSDHVQETCSTDFTSSDGSEDSYWSVRNFPVPDTRPEVSQIPLSHNTGIPCDGMKNQHEDEYHRTQAIHVLNLAPALSIVECVPPEQQSQLYEMNGNSTTHDNVWEQMKEEIAEYLTKSTQNEQEAQRKREEEEHVCEVDIVEFDADYVLSSLKEVLYDGKLSLCHFNFEQWVKQISKAEEKILLNGIVDLPLLGAINTVADDAFMFRTEKVGNPHCDFRDNPLNDLKLPNTTEEQSKFASIQWGILSTEERKICSVHVKSLKPFASWDPFPFIQECTIDAKLIIQGDPGVENNREIACISLLHPVTTDVRLLLPWDPGNFRSEIKTEWLPLQSGTTNVNLLFPWDPGEQGCIHVQNVENPKL